MAGAVIFDMDGVIVDSEVHWKKVESEFLSGVIPGWSQKDQASILGMSAYDVHAKLVREYGLTLTIEQYFGYYQGLAGAIYGELSSLLPGVDALITGLHERGTTLALCSSSPHAWIDLVLDRFNFRRCFAQVLSSQDVKGRGKPAPDIYLAALERLGCDAGETSAIEDTEKGIRSAKGAGLFCFGYRNGFNAEQDFSLADHVLESFALTPEELLRLPRRASL